MIDFNQALTRAEAKRRCRAMDHEGIYWIEEPVRLHHSEQNHNRSEDSGAESVSLTAFERTFRRDCLLDLAGRVVIGEHHKG